ncbi:MAG: Fic/DOC family N-terminal domain-containing protein [Daejeonella sp.]|uniref:Fic family protein n=1 Tax=Daejeonella sp. TaxID=2805397 RepID=UPI0027330314|nr:Fic/DOC family N-terminal domain-containing protein [Daejeonella sp.]MDP3468370.1 Fic/DOC family N-terminal domain-containing protein [Daejeonella sp.]
MQESYKVNPDRTKPWNDMPELPIAEELYKDIDIFEQLVLSRASLARLQGRSIAIPNQGLLINTISLQEAKASSAIENIFTTDDELYKAYSDQKYQMPQGASKEVLRYREALWAGYHYLSKLPGFDQNYFINIYQEINQVSDGIRPAFLNTVIKQGGSGLNAGTIVYTPPRGDGIVEQKLQNLIQFLNNVDDKTDPLIKMAIGHFQFEAIHPFRDGNGRTGRIFNIHYLTKMGLLDYPILFLSRYIIEHKDDYYNLLGGVSQRGRWKEWILYILKAMEVTSNITYDKINDILATKEAIMEEVVKHKDIRRPDRLVDLIFTQPFTKVKHLEDAKLYAEKTARNYLNKLTELGILERRSIEGGHYYLNLELYRILSE